MIVREDIQASNGVIHVVDRVLGPISTKKVLSYLQNPEDSSIRSQYVCFIDLWLVFQTTGRTRTFVNGAMIVREDIQASNGVIHVLDRVLGPISTKKVYDYINRPDDSSIRSQ